MRVALIGLGIVALVGAGVAALGLQYIAQRSAPEAISNILASRAGQATAVFDVTGRAFRAQGKRNEDFGPAGAKVALSDRALCYDSAGRPVPTSEAGEADCRTVTGTRFVADAASIGYAIRDAKAGQVIEIMPGTYRLSGQALYATAPGRPDAPIIVRAARLGDVHLEMETVEGFAIQAPYWVFENLDIRGACQTDYACQHAFHLSRDGRSAVIRNNRITDFDSQVKINAAPDQSTVPDDVLLDHNTILDTHPRDTAYPVTKVDSVRASGLTLVGNVIADFAKKGSDQRSYGAFAKGGGSRSRFERNLVICEWMHRGGERIGMSFGGGGTADMYCPGGKCDIEDRGGLMRSNVVVGCSDAGVYLRRAAGARIERNLLVGTKGIDARFPTTEATLSGNILDGRVMTWKGATVSKDANIDSAWRAALLKPITPGMFNGPMRGDFAAVGGWPASPVSPGSRDFCGTMFGPNAAAGPFGATCAPDIPALR